MERNYRSVQQERAKTTFTVGRTKVEHDYCVSDQQDGLCAHCQRADLEQYRIDFLSGNAEHAI